VRLRGRARSPSRICVRPADHTGIGGNGLTILNFVHVFVSNVSIGRTFARGRLMVSAPIREWRWDSSRALIFRTCILLKCLFRQVVSMKTPIAHQKVPLSPAGKTVSDLGGGHLAAPARHILATVDLLWHLYLRATGRRRDRVGDTGSSCRSICTARRRSDARRSEGAVVVLEVAMNEAMAAAGMNRRRPMITLESSPLLSRS
jgi:hypothetical protein